MIVRDLAVALGLDVNAASFAEGEAFISALKVGLSTVVSTANDVANAFIGIAGESKQIGTLGELFGGDAQKTSAEYAAGVDAAMGVAKEAITGTVAQMETALENAKTVHDYVFGYIRLTWAKLLQFVAPLIMEVTSFIIKNALFVRDIFMKITDFMKRNWSTVKWALIAGITAISAAFVILKWQAIKSAAAAAAAWLAAAWPFILLGGLIAGLLLALDDIRVYLQGGDSLFGRWKKRIEEWLSIKADDPPWLKSIKSFLVKVKEALTKQGAIEGFFARIKGFFADVWERIKAIDWSPFYRVFSWLADKVMEIDWKKWGLKIQAALGFVADKVREVNWDRWLLALKGIGLKLWGVYGTIKGMVQAVGSFIEKMSAANAAVRHFPSKVAGFVARIVGGKGEEGEEDAGRGAPSSAPPAGAAPAGAVSFDLPNFAAYQPEPPVYRSPGGPAVTQQHIVREGDRFEITQLPGEDGAALARRIIDESRARDNEDAAAAVPSTE